MEAHDLKISTADNAGADFAGFAESDHGEADGGEIAELAKGLNAGFKVQNFRHGEVDVLATDAESALPNVDEAILIGIHQRAKEDAAHQAEDGGVGADAQRQREHHGDRQPLGAPKRTNRNFQI